MPRFAANLSMMFNEVPFLDRFDAAAQAGFAAVEYLFPYEHPPEAIADRLKRNNLTQALFNLPPGNWSAGERGIAALSDRFDELRDGVATALTYAAATGVKRVHLMAGNADRNDPKALAAYRKAVAWTAEQVGAAGLDLLLEPINGRNMPGYFLNDFAFTREPDPRPRPAESENAVRHLPSPDHPRRRDDGHASHVSDHRTRPDREHTVAP